MVALANKIVEARWFQWGIIAAIVLNGAVIGLDTSLVLVARFGRWFELANDVFLGIFVLEAMVKIVAHYPRPWRYFKDGWNIFDFSVVVVSLLPSTGELAMLARLARLLRVLRLVSTLPELRLIAATLMRSIPSMFNVVCLMSIVFYIYAVAGNHLFRDIDPTHWRSLGMSFITLFRIVTLEDWTDVMYTAMEHHSWAWVYFVSFVVVGTFVIVNLFIAVVLNNLEEAKAERLSELATPPSRDELLRELRATQDSLLRLEQRLRDETAPPRQAPPRANNGEP